ncbi:hypothetical protein L9F63_003101 [Diploptera punctata]|uniref:Uncharacterized protein n=1 Tax=Diploptera punctata TaxID=6984 RepID=A0AAD7ZL77_DIPPU|nr:hypothetical protein L9F63_003101 [Diploptera punctata]
MKNRRSLRQTILIVTTQDKDEESDEDKKFIQEPLTYENLMCYLSKVTLPSSLWAVHKESTGKFVIFSCLSDNTSDIFISTDKTIMFEGSLKAEIFVRGRRIDTPFITLQNVDSFETMDALLKQVDKFELCKGTGLDSALYSAECSLILDPRYRYRNSRCGKCATKRTHMKKTEAQRLRRAAARKREVVKNTVISRKQFKKKEIKYVDNEPEIDVNETSNYFDKEDQQFTDGEVDENT